MYRNAAINAKKAGFDGVQIECGKQSVFSYCLGEENSTQLSDFCLGIIKSIQSIFGLEKISLKIDKFKKWDFLQRISEKMQFVEFKYEEN